MNMTKNKTTKEKEAAGFDYSTFEQEAIAGLTAGKGLIGPEGVLTGMIGENKEGKAGYLHLPFCGHMLRRICNKYLYDLSLG